MATQRDATFLNSAVVRPLPENCPNWVRAKIGINIPNLLKEIEQLKEDGILTTDWLNIEVKTAKSGKGYVEVNTWKPKAKAKAKAQG